MGFIHAVIESLPIAIGTVIATLPVVAIPLVLLTQRRIVLLQAFLGGYAAGFLLLGAVVILLADLFASGPGATATWVIWLRILIGLGLVAFAWRKWSKRKGAGKEVERPGWVDRLDTISPRGALQLGILVVVLNPKNVILVASGALTIAAATPHPVAQFAALIVFTAVAGSGVGMPLILWLTMQERAMPPLDRLRQAMDRNNATIMALVLFLIGLIILAGAAPYL